MPRPVIETVALPADGLGQTVTWTAWRFGEAGRGPKAYLQAGLHADEIPGMLVLHHLIEKLTAADVTGEIIIVPSTNPLGLKQWIGGNLLGRFELGGFGNFNRNYPWLGAKLAERIGAKLGKDAKANVALIRAEMLEILKESKPVSALDHLRLAVMERSVDADIALDLHCDSEAKMHLYMGPALWPAGSDLAAELDSAAVMLAEDSGGGSLDEAWGGPWWHLAKEFPDAAIPPACLSATVELRGEQDVTDELAGKDADAIFRFLARRGLIKGDPGPAPAYQGKAADLTACDYLRSPVAGVLVYSKQPGDYVIAGETVAEVVRPGEMRVPVVASTNGLLLVRLRHRFVRPGSSVGMVVGDAPLEHRKGYLLTE